MGGFLFLPSNTPVKTRLCIQQFLAWAQNVAVLIACTQKLRASDGVADGQPEEDDVRVGSKCVCWETSFSTHFISRPSLVAWL